MIILDPQGRMSGAGSPNYLDGPYGIDVATISGNKIAAVVSFDEASLSLFNIDDPENPVLTDSIQGSGIPNYLDGASNVKLTEIGGSWYAVVTSYLDDGVTIFDVDDPTNISQVGELLDEGGSILGGAYGLDIVTISGTEYAIVTSIRDDVLIIIDISTPAAPSESDSITGAGAPNYLDGAHGVVVIQVAATWYACVVSQFDHALSIFNINNPADISLTASIQGEGSPYYLSGAHSVVSLVIGASIYLFITAYGEDTLVGYDVSTPASPTYTDRISGGQDPNYLEEPTCIAAVVIGDGSFVLVASYLDDAVSVFDVSDPGNILLDSVVRGAGAPNYLGGAHGLYADTDSVLVTSYNEDTLVIFGILSIAGASITIDIVTDSTLDLELGVVGASITIDIVTDSAFDLDLDP